jgi:opacity protein-like surface antigen
MFRIQSGFVVLILLAASWLGGPTAHAQSAPLSYWTPGWPLGFGGHPAGGEDTNTYANFPGFDGTSANTRFNFGNGWFVGSARSDLGTGLRMGLSGIGQAGALGSFQTDGVQFGYNLKNAPVTFYAGFDTLKYNPGLGGVVAPFNSTSSSVGGYGINAGVEFRPTSNLSLQLGVGFAQQSNSVDTDTRTPALSNASQYDLVGGRH